MSTVLITGGSRGIGAAAVELFAAQGHRVSFLYEKQHDAAQALAEKTGATAICCDVADGQAVRRAFENLYADGGCIAQCEFGPGGKPENVRTVFEEWENLTARG